MAGWVDLAVWMDLNTGTSYAGALALRPSMAEAYVQSAALERHSKDEAAKATHVEAIASRIDNVVRAIGGLTRYLGSALQSVSRR